MSNIDTVPRKSRPQPKGGSRKGIPNKTTKALKDMILGALDGVGGQEYLQEQATKNPTAFMTLVGKVLPIDLKQSGDMTLNVTIKRYSGDAP